MKKIFAIIAVLLISMTGVFVGCSQDKYADLKIEVSSTAMVGDVITMGYNNTITISGKATGVKGVNPAVNFTCSDTEAIDVFGVQNDSNGTSATIKANKPTYGENYFILKVASVENNAVFKEIKIKVILPIEGIDFGGANLAVSPGNPLNLYEFIKFYPQEPFVTNQKDVIYDIVNYGKNAISDISITQSGVVSVTDAVVDNLRTDVIVDANTGEQFANHLQVKVVSKINPAINHVISLTVVKQLKDEDITFKSPQLSYNDAVVADKNTLTLFTNSEKFCEESVELEIVSSQDIVIIPIKEGNGNIIDITQDGNITKTTIDGTLYKNKATFKIRAKSTAGSCKVRFKVVAINIDNELTFEFGPDVCIQVATSALPRNITLKQDLLNIAQNDTFAVYNEYVATATTSNYGTKITPTVVSGGATSISELNKTVKVELISLNTAGDAFSEFILTDIKGNVIDTTAGYIELLSNNGVYIKATDIAVGNMYRLVFTTQIKDFIAYAGGGAPSVEEEVKVAEYFISANYGVDSIIFEKDAYVTKRFKATDTNNTETLINFSVNANADITGLRAEYDPTMLRVEKLDTFSYVVMGLNLGTTDFRIIAKNGYTKKVTVKIVDPLTGIRLLVDNPSTNDVLTQAIYDGDNNLVRVSAKVGGRFSIYNRTFPNATGILKTSYKTSDQTLATVSSTGVVSTRNAGRDIVITVEMECYAFYRGADDFAMCEVETHQITFLLDIFTPTTSITLSTYNVTVYSKDSLGYDYQTLSQAEINVLIAPATATIFGDKDAVTYELVNNNGILSQITEGEDGKYEALLPEGVDKATVLVVVTVEEFGSSITLVCTVNVIRAVQVEEIKIKNLVKEEVGYYFLDMKEAESFTLDIELTPDKVFISDLHIELYDEDMNRLSIGAPRIVTIDGKTIISKDTLDPADPTSMFIKIFAKDGLQTRTDDPNVDIVGKVFETIFITIQTGTLESPYLIETAADLQAIGEAPSKHYMLKNNIELSGMVWEPIEDFSGSLNGVYYRNAGGTEFAQENKITGLRLEPKSNENIGLFANILFNGLVFNLELGISEVIIAGSATATNVGIIAGVNEGLILNCAVTLGTGYTVQASDAAPAGSELSVGGMVGYNKGFIYNFAPFDDVGGYKRLYSAAQIEDVSVPTDYIELVGTKDSFLTISLKYADGSLPSRDIVQVNAIIAGLTSTNPVSGRINIADSSRTRIYVGGIAGQNEGVINGVYGLYNVQEESSSLAAGGAENEFIAGNVITGIINSEGKDFSGTITSGGASFNQDESAVGGIVGYNKAGAKEIYGGVHNVAASGSIKGQDNVGGIIGKSIGVVNITTISSSVRLEGATSVGGAIGYSQDAKIRLVKVENYQETAAGGDILIRASDNVGGVVGYIEGGKLEFAYAVSFVEKKTFTTGSKQNQKGDLYLTGNEYEVNFGGVAGYVSAGTSLAYVYSTMALYTSDTKDNCFVGGIAGSLNFTASINNSYFLGTYVLAPSTTNTTSGRGLVAGRIYTGGGAPGSPVEINFFFAHGNDSIIGNSNGATYTGTTTVKGMLQSQSAIDNHVSSFPDSNWNKNTDMNIYDSNRYPVMKYTSKVLTQEVCFIKQTPTAVEAVVKDTSPSTDERVRRIDSLTVVLAYSVNETKNTYRISDILTFKWTPDSIKSSALRVASSAPNILAVGDDGTITVKKVNQIGRATLTFTSVLNLNAYCTINVIVLPRIKEVALYSDSNLTEDLLRSGDVLSIKKLTTQKLFPVFYDIDRNGNRVQVDAGYYLKYEVAGYDYDATTGVLSSEYIEVNTNNAIITAKKETETPASLSFVVELAFEYNGVKYFDPFYPSAYAAQWPKTINIEVFTGATDIELSPNSQIEVSGYMSQEIYIDLVTDAKQDGVNLVILDDNGNVIFKKNGGIVICSAEDYYDEDKKAVAIASGYYPMTTTEEIAAAQAALDAINFMFDINYLQTEFIMVDPNYSAVVNIAIKEGKEYFLYPVGYTFRFEAVTSPSIVRDVRVVAIPQVMFDATTTYRVLEGSAPVSGGSSYFIFQENPRDKIVPGKLGLLSINTLPVYAGVEYFKVEVSGEAARYINLAQLYKDESALAVGNSYIFGKDAEYLPAGNGLKLNRLSNFLRTEYTTLSGDVLIDVPNENSNDYGSEIVKVEKIYDFDGNLYVEILTTNNIYEIDSFDVIVTAVYADGTEVSTPRTFETTYLPAIELRADDPLIEDSKESQRNFIAIGTRANGLPDTLNISYKVDGNYHIKLERSIIKSLAGGGDIATLFPDGSLVLGANANPGDVIRITASYDITIEGRTETVTSNLDIMVVDAVIDSYYVEKAVNNKLLFTISSSQQLHLNLVGCAEEGMMTKLSTTISRQLTPQNTIAFWKFVYANGSVTNLDNKSLPLPFDVNVKKVSSGDGAGLASIALVGSTVSGTARLMMRAFAYYDNDGFLKFAEQVNNDCLYPRLIELPFDAHVIVDSTDDLPTPIYTVSELYSMSDGGNYILMTDLDINTPHTPITAAISSFDGNNKVITISNFAYSSTAEGMNSSSINLGLFGTVYENTIIKNVIVALPNDKQNAMLLNNYQTINMGGIAGINNGVITNCEVISTYDKTIYEATTALSNSVYDLYKKISYTLNIYTAVQVNGNAVVANIGGLVGKNEATGVITNSRVGRDNVEVVRIQADDYNGTNPDLQTYDYTAPVTIFKLEGSGVVGGFAGTNNGIISSSYFANGQLEISSYGSNYTKTGGFVAMNTGAVYSSYSAGWEEEDFLLVVAATGKYSTVLSVNADGGSYYEVSAEQLNANRKIGGGIFSNGNIGGFVYSNSGFVQNCYANISLNGDFTFAANRQNISTNVSLTEYGNLNAGGFVFTNLGSGKVDTSYTIAKLKSNISTHGPFVGVSPSTGDVQNNGNVNKCYYLIEKNEEIYNADDPAYDISQISDSDLGDDVASIGNEFIIKDTFAGFSFDINDYSEGMNSGAVWAMKTISSSLSAGEDSQNAYGYPELISANKVAISVRVLKPNPTAGEGDADYTYIYALGYEKGSEINPQVITSAEDYNKVFNNILNVTVTFENINVKYTGNIRLVNNIDFIDLTPASSSFEFTSPINKLSVFDGNNLTISNVLLSDESESNTAYGLFKVLNGVGFKNLTLTIRSVDSTNGVAVGALTGVAANSDINNINIGAAVAGAEVSGQNYVGGLAGIIVAGDEKVMHYINNINCNVSVLASYNGLADNGTGGNLIKSGDIWNLIIPPAAINPSSTDNNLRLQYLKQNVSYAGGIAGVVDLLQAVKSNGDKAVLESLDNVNVRAVNVSQLNMFTTQAMTLYGANLIGIEAEYAGGLFGFIGNETFLREGSFIAYDKNAEHYIMADTSAGGITAINYGFIDQAYVSFDEETQKNLDRYLENLAEGATNITWGNQELYTGSPTYLGGIAGVNVGNEIKNTGTIQNAYNRVDLINRSATRIGGIAGASQIGAIVNAYTTANIVGNFTIEEAYYGGVIGQLLNNSNNRFITVSLGDDERDMYNLEITNVTVATMWNSQYFEEYKAYTDKYGIPTFKSYNGGDKVLDDNDQPIITNQAAIDAAIAGGTDIPETAYLLATQGQLVKKYGKPVLERKGKIGALYGAPTLADLDFSKAGNYENGATTEIAKANWKTYLTENISDEMAWYKFFTSFTLDAFAEYDSYLIGFSGDNVILETEIQKDYTAEELSVQLYCGVQHYAYKVDGDSNYVLDNGNKILEEAINITDLYSYLTLNPDVYKKAILTKADLKDLYTLEIGAVSNAKDKAFSQTYWSPRIWKFKEEDRLISLNFGYIPAIARIYTADDFVQMINDSPAAKKYYYIMADIDFSKRTTTVSKYPSISIKSNFRGTITGIKQKNADETKERYPILYNITLDNNSGGNPEMAMFLNTTNASFFNFNIVVSKYDDKIPATINRDAMMRSAVLIANANTTNINNVHIGYNLSEFTKGFLTEGQGTSKFLLYDDDDSTTQPPIDYDTIDLGLANNFDKIVSQSEFFGGFVADGKATTLNDCSFNIPVEIEYQTEYLSEAAKLYAGGIAGNLEGSISSSVVTRDFSVSSNAELTTAEDVYIGGVAGLIAGSATNVGFGRPNEDITNSFITKWRTHFSGATYSSFSVTDAGGAKITAQKIICIGGVFGYATKIVDTTSTKTSEISAAYVYNTNITVTTTGALDVGGVIGRTTIASSGFEYKNSTLDKDDGDMYVEASHNGTATKHVDVNIGGIIGNNEALVEMEQMYTNVSIRVKSDNNTYSTKHIGGIIGYATIGTYRNIINDGYMIKIDANKGSYYVGGIIGYVASKNSNNLMLNYVVNASYILFEDRDDSKSTVVVGGIIGYCDGFIVVGSVVNIGNIYIDKSAAISGLTVGGLFGYTEKIALEETGLGAVAATNVNYANIGSAATFNIGQLLGVLGNSDIIPAKDANSPSPFAKMYFSENLFGLYINSYYNQQVVAPYAGKVNLQMEELVAQISTLLLKNDSANGIRSYIARFEADKTQIYESVFTSNIVYEVVDVGGVPTPRLKGFEGSKLEPKTLTTVNAPELATKEYTYYKMSTDVTLSATLEKLAKGAFIDARGHSIIVDDSKKVVFTTVEREAFVVGLLIQDSKINNSSLESGIIATTNNGTLLGCGTAGSITAKVSSGLVNTNNGNIINCFSIANIYCVNNGSSAGLVSDNKGNIITSYFTGSLRHTDTNATIGGFVITNTGNITNSYTMSNIIDTGSLTTDSFNKTGAIYVNGDKNKLINVYYDRNAYTGKAGNYTDKGKTTAILSQLGAPENESKASIKGNWFLSKDNDIKSLYMEAYKGEGELGIKLTHAWFNYSYSIANVNGNIPTQAGIIRFLNMLYTGNGKKEDGLETNHFKNQPYKITNAGMIESYFLNSKTTGNDKNYYILQNDISFTSYDEWSNDWEVAATTSPVVFTGDFNGNGMLMYGIEKSKYGIFRILGAGAQVYNFKVTNVRSSTGILAGGMIGEDTGNSDTETIVRDVTIISKGGSPNHATCVVENNDAYAVSSLRMAAGTTDTGLMYKDKYIVGGLIGYMQGGFLGRKIDPAKSGEILIQGTLSVTASATGATATNSYAGGLVGIVEGKSHIDMKGESSAGHNPFGGLTELVVRAPGYIGGIAGLAKTQIKNYDLTNIVRLHDGTNGGAVVGGFIGRLETSSSNIVDLISLNNKGVDFGSSKSAIVGGIVGEIATENSSSAATSAILTNCTSTVGITATNIAGGIVAKANNVKISNSHMAASSAVTIKGTNHAGGVVGVCSSYIEFKGQEKGNYNANVTIEAPMAGGIVASMVNGYISGGTDLAKYICNAGTIKGATKGNIAGEIKTSTDENKNMAVKDDKIGVRLQYIKVELAKLSSGSDTIVGGVVGELVANDNATVEILNIDVNGTLTANANNIGGIVGHAKSRFYISDVDLNTSAISVTNGGADIYVGGVVGYIESSSVATNKQNITAVGSSGDYAVISISVSSLSKTNYYAGGLVGYAKSAVISASYVNITSNSTNMTATNHYIGGFVGNAENTTISNFHVIVSGGLSCTSTALVGGVVGRDKTSSIYNGDVVLKDDINGDSVGGVLGFSENTSLNKDTTDVIKVNSGVTSGDSPVILGAKAGGIVGSADKGVKFKPSKFEVSKGDTVFISIKATSYDSFLGGIAGTVSLTEDVTTTVNFDVHAKIEGTIGDMVSSGGVFGRLVKGKITGNPTTGTTGYTKNIIVNNVITGQHVGYVVGRVHTKTSVDTCLSGDVTIEKITIPVSSSGYSKNFAPNGIHVGGVVGWVDCDAATVTLDSLINKRTYSFVGDTYNVMINVGGIVGVIYSDAGDNTVELKNCTNETPISLEPTTEADRRLGGIVGEIKHNVSETYLKLTSCKNTAALTLKSRDCVGGIAGYVLRVSAIDCQNNAAITCILDNEDSNAGGLFGWIDAKSNIERSTANSSPAKMSSGTITGYTAGGIAGFITSTTIKGTSGKEINADNAIVAQKYGGGIVGRMGSSSAILDYINYTGNSVVGNANEAFVGGIMGYIASGSANAISFSNIKAVESPEIKSAFYVGGILGYAYNTTGLTMERITVTSAKVLSNGSNANGSAGGIIGKVIQGSFIIKSATVTSATIGDINIRHSGGVTGYQESVAGVTMESVEVTSCTIKSYKYAGGIASDYSAVGNESFSSVKSTSNTIVASANEDVFTGGAFGLLYVRANSVSGFGITVSSCTMKSTTTENGSDYSGMAGGFAGRISSTTAYKEAAAYNGYGGCIKLTDVVMGAGNSIGAHYMGGGFGYLDTVNIDFLEQDKQFTILNAGNRAVIGGTVGATNGGLIWDCDNKMTIYNTNSDVANVGGIVGYAGGSTWIDGCDVEGTISAGSSYGNDVGGIVAGAGNAKINSCSYKGSLTAGSAAGGILGAASNGSGEVTSCTVKTGTAIRVYNYNGSSYRNTAVYSGGIAGYLESNAQYKVNSNTVRSSVSVNGYYINTAWAYDNFAVDWSDRDNPSWYYDYCCTADSYSQAASCYVGGIVAYWPITSGTAELKSNKFEGVINPSMKGTDSTWDTPGQFMITTETSWNNSASAYICSYSGAIIGWRGSAISVASCTYTTSDIVTWSTRGCGGNFSGYREGGLATKVATLTEGAINNALSSGRTSGSTSGISRT